MHRYRSCDDRENVPRQKYRPGIFVDISALPSDGDFAAFSGLIKGSLDNVIIKYDSSGLMKWNYVLSSNGRDYFDNVCADGSGGCLAGGSFSLKNASDRAVLWSAQGVDIMRTQYSLITNKAEGHGFTPHPRHDV